MEVRVSKRIEVAKRLADELASCDIKLVASLPDNWIAELIETIAHDNRFLHVSVNREESAIGLCSGAYIGGTGSAALMGASGFACHTGSSAGSLPSARAISRTWLAIEPQHEPM